MFIKRKEVNLMKKKNFTISVKYVLVLIKIRYYGMSIQWRNTNLQQQGDDKV